MNKVLTKIVLAAATMLLAACSDNHSEPDETSIEVTPDASYVASLYSGEKYLYEVSVNSQSSGIRLKITTFEQQNGLQTVKDTTFNATSGKCSYIYTAPELLREKTEVRLTFTATDSEGHEATTIRKANVHSRGVSLEEITGIILSAPGTGLPDALILSDVSRPFVLADAPRPDTADVYIQAAPGFDDITMLSKTETKFSRINNFNYSNASASTISAVYAGSVPTDLVNNVQVNDIILVGHEKSARGVFQIVDITRGATAHMRLNYKGINSSSEKK